MRPNHAQHSAHLFRVVVQAERQHNERLRRRELLQRCQQQPAVRCGLGVRVVDQIAATDHVPRRTLATGGAAAAWTAAAWTVAGGVCCSAAVTATASGGPPAPLNQLPESGSC